MPANLPSLFEAPKMLTAWFRWVERDEPGPARRFTLVAPLDIDGVTVEGLRFRAMAPKDQVDECVTFQLEYQPAPRDGRSALSNRMAAN
jgi:hypothetical protein